MSEFGIQTPEHLIQDVRAEQNEIEETMREHILGAKLFRDAYTQRLLDMDNLDINIAFLRDQFLIDKKDKENMGDVFDLAINPPYLDAIHVVELGSITDLGKKGEIDGLKHDYLHLLDWLERNTEIKGELPRKESARYIRILPSKIAERDGSFVVMERARPLVHGRITHNGQELEIKILKRMIFTMPKATAIAIANKNEEGIEYLEDELLPNGYGGIKPIRTTYYLATNIIS